MRGAHCPGEPPTAGSPQAAQRILREAGRDVGNSWRKSLVAVAIGATVFSACAQQATPAAPAAAPAAASVRGAGGEVKLLFNQGPVILNVHLSAGAKDQDASRPILEPL